MNKTQKYIVLWTLNHLISDPLISLELRQLKKGLDHRIEYSLSLDHLPDTKEEAEYFLSLINTLENLNLIWFETIPNLKEEVKGIEKLNNFLEQLNIPTYEITSFLKQRVDRRNA